MLRRLLPHGLFILAVIFITLDILDSYNPAMGFLTSLPAKWMQMFFCGAAAYCAISMIIKNRARE